MKLLLVYPPIKRSERYQGGYGVFGGSQIPLGLFCLAAYIRQHGHEVEAVDAEAQNLSSEAILTLIQEGSFEVMGLSATTVAFPRALEVAQKVKAVLPDLPVILGGPFTSSQPKYALQYPAFDYIIPHEGEESLLALLRCLESKGAIDEVLGVLYRHDEHIIVNPPRPMIENLASLPPPAFDMIPDITVYTPPPFNYSKRPVANVITSRGCPNSCTFCENTTFGRKVRWRSAKSIVDEIDMLINQHGIREIAFVDDTFTIDQKRVREIFSLLAQRGLRFPWSCMSRINTVDESLLTYMRDQGCWLMAFGIESGSQEILKNIKKKISLESVRRVIGVCDRLGIRSKGFFMVGHPGETEETMEQTIDLACNLPLDQVVVTVNTPMPGSEQFENVEKYGKLQQFSPSDFNYWNPVFVPFGLTAEQVIKKQGAFLHRFYLRPKQIGGFLSNRPGRLSTHVLHLLGNILKQFIINPVLSRF
jgi:anaerobic magnesium-protoporphyrin IX monomethyl ester cyclase